ncbi:methyltransferase domain-containing protein [Knoellia locipacati]|uniref:class I SAM-dependent methyltransferase n=1 Tax=Knoellia locipacati TaxID=882824 RepID=UPI0038509315
MAGSREMDMSKYARMYRLGIAPWERYATTAADGIASLLEREESERSRPLGRALDLGCGRGKYTALLAGRGWKAVGIDNVPAAIDAARRTGAEGATYVVGDVTDLPATGLGTFDLFLDVGCFQGLSSRQRDAYARGVLALANPGATLLLLAFGRTWMRSLVEGVSQGEVESAFRGWELLSADPATTQGLGWPMNRTGPQWYRLGGHRQDDTAV